MNDYINSRDAVEFYRTLVQLLQGGEVVLFIPQGDHVTVATTTCEDVHPSDSYENSLTTVSAYRGLLHVAS